MTQTIDTQTEPSENAPLSGFTGQQSLANPVSAQVSCAIGIARIVLIVGLVFLHYGSFPNSAISPFEGIDVQAHRFATWVNSSVLFFFFSAVPLMSMVSGWLFFSFKPADAWPVIKKRMGRRFLSLYVPLVAWNAAYMLILYALFRTHPDMAFFTQSQRFNIHFATSPWPDYVNAVFAISEEPIGFQFWFVRDLFLSCLFSPVWWLLLRRAPWLGAGVLCLLWISGATLGIFFRFDVPFFFYLGGLMRQKQLPLALPTRWTILFVSLFVLLACLRSLAPYVTLTIPNDPYWLEVVTRLMRPIGVLGCWGLIYRLAETRTGIALSRYGGLAFFLHSAHWPLLAVVKLAIWRFMPGDNDAWMLLHYLLSVAATVAICLLAGMGLARCAPRVFALMNGGRLLGQARDSASRAPAMAGAV